jgi:hypothetical protein
LWVQNWDRFQPGYSEGSLVNATLPFARAYVRASTAQAAALGKPLVLEEFGFPRDLGSLSALAPTTRRDAYYAVIFDALLASAGASGALAGVNFWAYAGEGRPVARGVPATRADLCGGTGPRTLVYNASAPPDVSLTGAPPDWGACFTSQDARGPACSRDTWWAPPDAWPPGSYIGQDTLLGDPPHESQGWYSTFETDDTMDVIKRYTTQLNATLACTTAAVRSARSGKPGNDAGTIACTAPIPGGRAGNLC